jgi:hypothetical protein
VIFDVTIVIALGRHEERPYKAAKLINVVCFLTALLRAPYSLKHNSIEIRPINNPTMASKCSSEGSNKVFVKLRYVHFLGIILLHT